MLLSKSIEIRQSETASRPTIRRSRICVFTQPRPNPDRVRARLHKILAEARAAQTSPWEPARVSLYRTIFPQMTLWLPEDEAAQLRFEFETEMARLETV